MKRILGLWACIIILLSSCCGCGRVEQKAAPIAYTVKDDRGTVTGFARAPEKVMTLGIWLDWMALGLVPPEQMVSVNSLLDDPISSNIVDLAKKIPSKHVNPTAEYIYAKKPDVLFVDKFVRADLVATIRDMGIKVVLIKYPNSIEDVKSGVRLMAKALAKEKQGESIVSQMEGHLAQLHAKMAKYADQQPQRVALISVMTDYGGKGTIWDGICREAGVINCISDVGLSHGQVYSKELLIKSCPDVLLLPGYTAHGTFDIQKFRNQYLQDPALATLPAIRKQKLYAPRDSYIYNCSQDVVFAVQELAACVYGEEFAQKDNLHIYAY